MHMYPSTVCVEMRCISSRQYADNCPPACNEWFGIKHTNWGTTHKYTHTPKHLPIWVCEICLSQLSIANSPTPVAEAETACQKWGGSVFMEWVVYLKHTFVLNTSCIVYLAIIYICPIYILQFWGAQPPLFKKWGGGSSPPCPPQALCLSELWIHWGQCGFCRMLGNSLLTS